MNKTKIEYLTHTWSPIAMRCTPVSAGCANCWHLAMANRLTANRAFPPEVRDAYAGEGPPVLIKYRLDEPLRCRKPATVGVQFMGDLFHEDVPDAFILRVFDTIAITPQHTYQILTKRPLSMLDWYEKMTQRGYLAVQGPDGRIFDNAWLGVSIENQAAADERIPLLLQTPAAVRFVSGEPLLGPVDLTKVRVSSMEIMNAFTGESTTPHSNPPHLHCGISWCIIGAESGPSARPMDENWVRGLVAQCKQYQIPVFYKQKIVDKKKISLPTLDGRQYIEFPPTIHRLSVR